jgi:hypothetical protein
MQRAGAGAAAVAAQARRPAWLLLPRLAAGRARAAARKAARWRPCKTGAFGALPT